MTTRTVAGHHIRDTDGRCDTCGRSVHDVMSNAEGARSGDDGIACIGRLNDAELSQIEVERERRRRVWDAVEGVAA